MVADHAGQLTLLPATGSALAQRLARHPAVTVSVACAQPFRALRLTGVARPCEQAGDGYQVTIVSLRFTGPRGHPVPLIRYLAAAPDPLWRQAPGILRHLEHGHMAELVACIRAHGIPQAQWVLPRSLDRFGLQFVILTPTGAASIRLSFPDGPITGLKDIPASLQAVLTCRCPASCLHAADGP
jgi:hypothetical protein